MHIVIFFFFFLRQTMLLPCISVILLEFCYVVTKVVYSFGKFSNLWLIGFVSNKYNEGIFLFNLPILNFNFSSIEGVFINVRIDSALP